MFALRLWLSATPETDAPSCEHCCRTWAFNCALYARRLGTSSVDSLSIVSTISFVYTMPYLANRLKMGSPPAYVDRAIPAINITVLIQDISPSNEGFTVRKVLPLWGTWRLTCEVPMTIYLGSTPCEEECASVAARREHGDGIWSNSDGDLRLTPIFSFSTDDVWETLGYAAAGLLESYSDFSEVIEFYRDAGGGCVVLSADAVRGSSTPCSTRSGCWSCTRAGKTDRSAE